MRTTMTVEDEALDMCRDMAEQQGMSLGDAVGIMIRRGLAYRSPYTERNGFAVFQDIPEHGKFGPDEVKKALAEEDVEYAGSFFAPKS